MHRHPDGWKRTCRHQRDKHLCLIVRIANACQPPALLLGERRQKRLHFLPDLFWFKGCDFWHFLFLPEKKKNTFYSRDLSSISVVKRRLISLICLMKVWEHRKPLYTSSLCEWPVYESHSWGSALKSRKPCQSQGFSLGALRTDRIGQGAPEQPFWCMEYLVCSSFLGVLQTCVLLLYFSFPEYNTHLKTLPTWSFVKESVPWEIAAIWYPSLLPILFCF